MVDHADIANLQLGHTVGHQVDDGHDLLRVELVPRTHLQHDRGLGRIAVADDERVAFLHRQMHPRTVDALEGHDGTGQLAFQAALEAHVLDKLTGA
ncbi:hypothetical protein D3C78_1602550 [compost metagenome]